MLKIIKVLPILIVLLLTACSYKHDYKHDYKNNYNNRSIEIIKKPVSFDAQREQLSLDYLKNRHGIETNSVDIEPKMIVVHYTVIPTLEKTLQVFDNATLPSSRTAITGASQLNVSSQFVIDQDGSIYQILPKETTFARHVIGLNYCAIGIENIGDATDTPLTKSQLDANVALITYLKNKYQGIDYLIGHQEYNNFRSHALWKESDANYRTEKTDPGIEFMNNIRAEVKKLKLLGPPD